VGRGGWTWYTGSAGWMYRTGVEGILGIQQHGKKLKVAPCLPKTWGGFEFTFKFGSSRYRIEVENRRGQSQDGLTFMLDGQKLPDGVNEIDLIDDGRYHYGKLLLA
jgi:cyclic beta-1,2-glucan synthetase